MKFIAEACAAEIQNGPADTVIKNVCTDSRTAKAGEELSSPSGSVSVGALGTTSPSGPKPQNSTPHCWSR